jgi:hypothetical protein
MMKSRIRHKKPPLDGKIGSIYDGAKARCDDEMLAPSDDPYEVRGLTIWNSDDVEVGSFATSSLFRIP